MVNRARSGQPNRTVCPLWEHTPPLRLCGKSFILRGPFSTVREVLPSKEPRLILRVQVLRRGDQDVKEL